MRSRSTQTPKWNQGDLIRRLCHALDIASRALQHLAPAGYTDANRPAASIRPEKVIAETAVLLHGASLAAHHHEVKTRIHRVARQLVPHARSPQIRLGLALNPALAFDYSLAHVLLTRLGYRDTGFEDLLTQCRNSQVHAGRERVPHRALEQEWIESQRTAAPGSRAIARAARQTILARPMDLFSGTDEDLYAFTHAVMYVTGIELKPGLLPRTRAVILAEAEAALARCLDSQDYDLAGEILLAWPLTGKTWGAAAAFAFQVLADVEDQAGFLPTPATRLDELNARQGDDRSQYLLATAYHTAYVMGLLCAAALQPGCAPPASIAAHSGEPASAWQILPRLNQSGSVPHWRASFARLDPAHTGALSGFLFNIALQRHAAARDFAALADTLRLGYDLGLADSPAASQAAELIGRVAACASAIAPQQPVTHKSNAHSAPRELPFGFTFVSAAAPSAIHAS